MTTKREIHCCGCNQKVNARLTHGAEIYPYRPYLAVLPFWICDTCGAYVGCHYKTKKRTNPLGILATQEIRNARKEIHKILDPLWQDGFFTRKEIYKRITDFFGWKYHSAKIKDLQEAREIYKFIKKTWYSHESNPYS